MRGGNDPGAGALGAWVGFRLERIWVQSKLPVWEGAS